MRKQVLRGISTMLAVCCYGLYGCSKEEEAVVAPQAVQQQEINQADPALAAKAKVAWLSFVRKVERGEIVDPLGQYVSSKTKISNGTRVTRPKYNALLSRRLVQNENGEFEIVSLVPSTTASRSGPNGDGAITNGPAPDDPPMECPPGGCVGVPVPPVAPTFITSLGRGGSGAILDLKLIANSSVGYGLQPPGNYLKLELNLNQGAGGSNIYLCFTRDPASVLNGYEYNQGQPYTSPNDILRAFTIREGGAFSGIPSPPDRFAHIWVPNQYPNYNWDRVELNAGAGGEYIWPYQSKDPSALGLGTYTNPITEIGILAGNNDRIQPPAGQGWTRFNYDLNKGAGGDYIYFCYR